MLKKSPCCKAKIDGQRTDGVMAGSCSKCNKWVVRQNPQTGEEETLMDKDGNEVGSPWHGIDDRLIAATDVSR